MRHWAVFLGLLVASPAWADTHFMATTGRDRGNCRQVAPCLTLKYSFSQMAGGDTLTIADGTYTGLNKAIQYWSGHGGAVWLPPIGAPGRYTVIRAEHEGQVVFDGENTNAMFSVYRGKLQYTEFRGPKWYNTRVALLYDEGTAGSDIHHVKWFRCGVMATRNFSVIFANWYICSGWYLLFEECYGWGAGRYVFVVQDLYGTYPGREAHGAKYVIFRRCVARHDDAIAQTGSIGNPISAFYTYNSSNVEWQNCIVIDVDTSKFGQVSNLEGALGWRTHETNMGYSYDLAHRGNIVLNVTGWKTAPQSSYYAAYRPLAEDSAHPQTVERVVA